MTLANYYRRNIRSGARLSCVAVLGLLLFCAAARPARAAGTTFFDGLDFFDTARWHKADGWTNGNPFNVGWRADHVTFSSGFMTLQLDTTPCPTGCSGKPYASGEYRTNDNYGYGKYETRFKAAKGSGLVTSFFTYTGTFGQSSHHEIDIEILGKVHQDADQLLHGGVGVHEHMVNLVSTLRPVHNYPSSGRRIRRVDRRRRGGDTEYAAAASAAESAGKIMVNMWRGRGWMTGSPVLVPGDPITAKYDWIQYFVLYEWRGPGVMRRGSW